MEALLPDVDRRVEGPVDRDLALAVPGRVQADVVLAVDGAVDLDVDLAAGADVKRDVRSRVECIALRGGSGSSRAYVIQLLRLQTVAS